MHDYPYDLKVLHVEELCEASIIHNIKVGFQGYRIRSIIFRVNGIIYVRIEIVRSYFNFICELHFDKTWSAFKILSPKNLNRIN